VGSIATQLKTGAMMQKTLARPALRRARVV
jgi:hypothetical protein